MLKLAYVFGRFWQPLKLSQAKPNQIKSNNDCQLGQVEVANCFMVKIKCGMRGHLANFEASLWRNKLENFPELVYLWCCLIYSSLGAAPSTEEQHNGIDKVAQLRIYCSFLFVLYCSGHLLHYPRFIETHIPRDLSP